MRNVVRVESAEQLMAVARLRYRVYVEEMGRAEPHADHSTRTVIDPDDQRAIVLAAFDADGEATGTVRYQAFADLASDDIDFHGFATMPVYLQHRSSLTAKLITDSRHRRGLLTSRLMLGIFHAGYECLGRINFINCNPPLDRFFARFGFVAMGEPKDHPLYGMVYIMMLPMADLAFFEAINSPFASLLRELGSDDAAAQATRAWCESLGVRYWKCRQAAYGSEIVARPGLE